MHLTPRTHLAPRTSRQAVLTLGIDADLRSVWNWNVKQLFVYVTAEYETKPNVLNQVVVWDTIISDSPSVRTRPLRVTAPPADVQSTQPRRAFECVCRPHCRRGFAHRRR